MQRLALVVLLVMGCSKSADSPKVLEDVPFQGPGWNSQAGELINPQASYVVSVTYLQVSQDPEAVTTRDELVFPILEHLNTEAPGHVGHAIQLDTTTNQAWTITVWESEADRFGFVNHPVHFTGVPTIGPYVVEDAFTHYDEVAANIPPTFAEAIPRLPPP